MFLSQNRSLKNPARILEKAELPRIRLYDLRHSCATLWLVANQHPKVVGERLGHSTTRLTMDTYSHVLPTMQQGATDVLGRLLYSENKKVSGAKKASVKLTGTETIPLRRRS